MTNEELKAALIAKDDDMTDVEAQIFMERVDLVLAERKEALKAEIIEAVDATWEERAASLKSEVMAEVNAAWPAWKEQVKQEIMAELPESVSPQTVIIAETVPTASENPEKQAAWDALLVEYARIKTMPDTPTTAAA